MPGHVFHPGHAALHGVTVVLETRKAGTFVGRYDSEDDAAVHLHDVGVHDPAAGISNEEFLRRCDRFGIRVEHRDLTIPHGEIVRIQKLIDAVR